MSCYFVPMKRLQDVNGSVECLWPALEAERPDHARRRAVPQPAGPDSADRTAVVDELKSSLEKATRRINRLQGERNQLADLLEKRDGQIERLSRELGRYQASPGRPSGAAVEASRLRPPFTAQFSAMVHGLRAMVVRQPEPMVGAAPEIDARQSGKGEGLYSTSLRGGGMGQRVVGVLLFGLSQDQIQHLLPMIERDCSSKEMKPLCLVDVDAFELFRERNLLFEYLPPVDERCRFDASLHWDLYLQRRLAIIRKKWEPIRIVAFGQSAMKTLTLWSSSPFETRPLPTAFLHSRDTQAQEGDLKL